MNLVKVALTGCVRMGRGLPELALVSLHGLIKEGSDYSPHSVGGLHCGIKQRHEDGSSHHSL